MNFVNIVWNPSDTLFDLGFFQVRYYSLMFVLAFTIGWYLMKKIFINEKKSLDKLDSLFIYTVIATLVGARLGHVFSMTGTILANIQLKSYSPSDLIHLNLLDLPV